MHLAYRTYNGGLVRNTVRHKCVLFNSIQCSNELLGVTEGLSRQPSIVYALKTTADGGLGSRSCTPTEAKKEKNNTRSKGEKNKEMCMSMYMILSTSTQSTQHKLYDLQMPHSRNTATTQKPPKMCMDKKGLHLCVLDCLYWLGETRLME